MKLFQIIAFGVTISWANAAALIDSRYSYETSGLTGASVSSRWTNSSIVPADDTIDLPESIELVLQDDLVIAVKEVSEEVLDAFREFGDVAGGFESLLENTGYVVEVSEQKRSGKVLRKRGYFSVLMNILRSVLNGVSVITDVLADSQPELEFVGSAASAISRLL